MVSVIGEGAFKIPRLTEVTERENGLAILVVILPETEALLPATREVGNVTAVGLNIMSAWDALITTVTVITKEPGAMLVIRMPFGGKSVLALLSVYALKVKVLV
jgi:hypothetical protein